MNARSRKAEQKRAYEAIKNIKTRLANGEKTTFQERQIVNIYNDRVNKKKKS